MRALAFALLGALALTAFGGCYGGCPKSGYAPCTFTYEVDRHCYTKQCCPPVTPEVVRSQP